MKDEKTDQAIQEVFSKKFLDRTVLIIAHRLETIAQCDQLLVLDGGFITKFDTSDRILQRYQ